MRILQTLGNSIQTQMPGAFFYRRVPSGIEIFNVDGSLTDEISNNDWRTILTCVSQNSKFTLTGGSNSLYSILSSCNYTNTTLCSRIAAILEHEGSIDFDGSVNRPINLRSDM